MNLENLYRKKISLQDYLKDKNNVKLQILDIFHRDEELEDSEKPKYNKELIFYLFGVTEYGKSITVKLHGFYPFFYIKVPNNWGKSHKNEFIQIIREKLSYCDNPIITNQCKIMEKKIFFGFRGDEKNRFVKIVFSSLQMYYNCRKMFKDGSITFKKISLFEMYEHTIDLYIKFIHQLQIKPASWVELSTLGINEIYDCNTQINLETDISNIKFCEVDKIASFRQMSFDIEVYSNDPDKFPSEHIKENAIIQIASSFKDYGSDDICLKHILVLGNCKPINNIKNAYVEVCKSEKELLLKWSELIVNMDPDILYAYNNFNFDDRYIWTRFEINKCGTFPYFTKIQDIPTKLSEQTFSSSAYGSTIIKKLDICGRINLDLFVYINREKKLDSYKLDAVSEIFLKETFKIPNEFFKDEKISGNTFNIKSNNYNKYIDLRKHLTIKTKTEIYELGEITNKNDITFIIETINEIPEINVEDITDIILDIHKNPISPRDMFSTYKPFFENQEYDSDKIKDVAEYCIQDTVIPQRLIDKMSVFLNQLQMSNVCYTPFRFIVSKGQQYKIISQIYKETSSRGFVIPILPPDNSPFQGACVLKPQKGAYFKPVIVLDFASLYPSIIRAHNLCYSTIVKDDEKYGNLPGIEYDTFEIDMRKKICVCCKDDLSVTKFTNINNPKCENCEEDNVKIRIKDYKPSIVGHIKKVKYAINVPGIIPDLLTKLLQERKNTRTLMKTESDPFKLSVLDGLQLAFKVSANSIYGFFGAQKLPCREISSTVTAIGRNMIMATKNHIETDYPEFECLYGDSVTGDTPILLRNKKTKEINIKTIETLGKDWNSYENFKVNDTIISNRREKEFSLNDKYEVWSAKGWTNIKKIIKHKCNKKIYRIQTLHGIVDVTEDHSLLTTDMKKIKPLELLDLRVTKNLLHKWPENITKWPENNYYYITAHIYKGFSKLEAQKFYLKFKNNINVIRPFMIKDYISFEVCKDSKDTFNNNKVLFYELLHENYSEYVYDIETDDGSFQAGIGSLIVSNTDSVFICKKNEKDIKLSDTNLVNKKLEEYYKIGFQMEKTSTELFINPIVMEFEKVQLPLLLFKKKSYVTDNYLPKLFTPKRDVKGLSLKRRDNAKILKIIYSHILDTVFSEGRNGINISVSYLHNELLKILNNKTDIKNLIVTKTYKTNYKSDNIPHKYLVEQKLAKRGDCEVPKPNDRVPYIFIEIKGNDNNKQYLKVEDPEYAIKHNLQIDSLYYMKQIRNPLIQLFSIFGLKDNVDKIFTRLEMEYTNRKRGVQDISKFLIKK